MDHREHLLRMFAHDAWANRETLASLRRSPAPPPFAVAVLAHILAVERLWFARLTRSGDKRDGGPCPSTALRRFLAT